MKGFIFLEVHDYLGMKGLSFCSVGEEINILKLLISTIPSPYNAAKHLRFNENFNIFRKQLNLRADSC